MFMKKILLLGAAALLAVGANAQLLRTVNKPVNLANKPHRVVKSQPLTPEQVKFTDHQMREHGDFSNVKRTPKRANADLDPVYKRPAGAFSANFLYSNSRKTILQYYGSFYAFKPYALYTFDGSCEGAGPDTKYYWDVFYDSGQEDADGYPVYEMDMFDDMEDLTYSWGYEYGDMPIFYAVDNEDDEWPQFQLGGYDMGEDPKNPTRGDFHSSSYASASDYHTFFGGFPFWSSKDMCSGGHFGTSGSIYNTMPITGMDPYTGGNEYGWWLGKNGGTVSTEDGTKRTLRIDGVAQAFEKPTHPYVLDRVMIMTYAYFLKVTAPVELECKIYKLDEIPAYDEDETVVLRESDFGELVATGRTIINSATKTDDMGVFYFTLYSERNGIPIEVTPTIDYPILVVFEDYNSPSKSNLVDFTLEYCTDDETDEGYGELAYIKYGINDEDGNFTGQYVWAGLNNFFVSGTMKTGVTIFLDIENPFLTFYYGEDAEYTFPNEGGLMRKTVEGSNGPETTESIEFFSWVASADDGWLITSADGSAAPDWLHFTLTDGVYASGQYAGEFNNRVNAKVVADPLPEGMKGRKAVVRFGFPGAFLDYTFIQGDAVPVPGDVNEDGEVNIADVNALIDMILGGNVTALGDVNNDSEVNIADVNALIDLILGA